MTLESAMQVAKEYFAEQELPDILEVYETNNAWIFFGGISGVIMYGSFGISISKESGQICDFDLPSDENFAILENATKIV